MRQKKIEERIGEIQQGKFVEIIQDVYKKYYGCHCIGVNWFRYPCKLLVEISQVIIYFPSKKEKEKEKLLKLKKIYSV